MFKKFEIDFEFEMLDRLMKGEEETMYIPTAMLKTNQTT
jgi:hypothetical protein